jgi:hypothetical protein
MTRAGVVSTEHPAPAVVRWAPLGAFLLLLLSIARRAGGGISDPDTLWHVLAGEHLWRTRRFVGPDPLSDFTTEPWVLNQWLPELGLAGADYLGGLPAVAFVAQATLLAVCVALFLLCRQMSGPLAAALVASAAVLGAADSLSPRPQLVGFILLAIVVRAWICTAQDLRPRWWLIPVMWLWASCHGTWVAGMTVGAATVIGLALDRRMTLRQCMRFGALLAVSLLVTAITPLGPRLYESFATVRAVSPYILEWRLPTFSSPSVCLTAALVTVVPCLWLRRRARPRWTRALLWITGAVWAAASMRTVALGAIIIAPLAAEAVDYFIGRPRPAVSRAERGVVAGGLVVALGLAGVLALTGPRVPQGVPTGLDRSLAALPRGSVVWNSDLLGGWLMLGHPDLRHTADTRAEIYGPVLARAYLRVLGALPGWERDFDALAPGAVLVEEEAPLVHALTSRGWTVRGSEAGYVLLLPSR